jgi:hypothetical protein
MFQNGSDERIRARYRDLRDAESERVPSFERVLTTRQPAPNRLSWVLVPLGVVALAVASFLLVPSPATRPTPPTAQTAPQPAVSTENSNVAAAPDVTVSDPEPASKTHKRAKQARRPQPQPQPSDQCAEC